MSKKKDLLPSKADIFEHWKTSKEHFIIDWYEPSCWACGEWWAGRYDVDLEKTGSGEKIRKRIWNSVPLQKCHIIAKSLGGKDTVDNLFLMCKDCHDLSPNTRSKELFLLWARNQGSRKSKEIKHVLDSFELNESEMESMMTHFRSESFYNWMSENSALHWNQNTGGCKLNMATQIAALIQYIRLQA